MEFNVREQFRMPGNSTQTPWIWSIKRKFKNKIGGGSVIRKMFMVAKGSNLFRCKLSKLIARWRSARSALRQLSMQLRFAAVGSKVRPEMERYNGADIRVSAAAEAPGGLCNLWFAHGLCQNVRRTCPAWACSRSISMEIVWCLNSNLFKLNTRRNYYDNRGFPSLFLRNRFASCLCSSATRPHWS